MPSAQDLGTSPAPQPSAGVQADRSASMMDEGQGRGLMAAGEGLQAAGQELWALKEKTDTIKVEDAWNAYRQSALQITNGKDGTLTTLGSDAVNGNLVERTGRGLTDARTKIAETLTDDQKRRFFQRASVTDVETQSQVLRHLTQQQLAYGHTVFQGNEAAAKAQVSSAPTDPGVFEGARTTLMAQADVYLKQIGNTDPNVTTTIKAKLNDSLWTSRINALLYDKPVLADAMFRANEKEIKDPELRLLMQAKTREASMVVNAANEAQGIMDATRSELAKPQPAGIPVSAAPALIDDTGKPVTASNRGPLPKNVPPEEAEAYYAAQDASRRGEKFVIDANFRPRVVQTSTQVLAPNTSGMPNSRDVAAQLPVMMGKVEERAMALYGADRNNPDRAAFVRRLTSELQAKVSQDVQQLNAIQREAQGKLIDAITGMGGSAPGGAGGLMPTAAGGAQQQPARITSFAQIQASPDLMRAWQMTDPQAKIALENMMQRNLQADDKGDVLLFREIFNRIHLDPADPRKVNFYQQIVDPAIANRLSMPQIQQLRAELDRDETPGGRSLNQLRKSADANVGLYFRTNIMFTAQPERQIAATMQWNQDAAKKIDEYVKQGKDVRSLLMLDTPDSIVSPKYLQSYVNSTPAAGLSEGAAAVKAGAQPVNIARAPATIKTPADAEAWIKTLPEGATMFIDPAGQVRQIPPRQATAPPAAPAQQGLITPGNIDLNARPIVKNADGTISTVRSMSFREGDVEVLVPTVAADGSRILSNDEAVAQYRKSGQFLGKFATPEAATQYALQLHDDQAKQYAPQMNDQGKLVSPGAPTPATTAPATADQFQLVDKPDTVAGNIEALRKAREGALAIAREGAAGPRFQLGAPWLSTLRGLKTVFIDKPQEFGRAFRSMVLTGLIPTEVDAVYNGFQAIKQSGRVSRQDEDVLRQVLDFGMLPPDDEKLAKGLLERLKAGKK